MGLFVEFDVVDDFGFLDETEEYGIVPDYGAGCQVFVDTFMSTATNLVPVDTGYLRSTIEADSADTYCFAEATAEYAQYPEYGTWCQTAQPYFEPALEAAIEAAAPLWYEAEADALAEEEALIEQEEEEMEDGERMGRGDRGMGSGLAGMAGAIAGAAIVQLATTVLYHMGFGALTDPNYGERGGHGGSGRSGSHGSWGGGGSVYIPDVEIT